MNTTIGPWGRAGRAFFMAGATAGLLTSTVSIAQNVAAVQAGADALLAVDQHRATVIERVVSQWGDQRVASSARLNAEQLRTMLTGLRADHLLAASLAGSLSGLRDVLAYALTGSTAVKPNVLQTKALGDSADDVVYTPVTPCRLVETRGTFAAVYQGGGAFSGAPCARRGTGQSHCSARDCHAEEDPTTGSV